MPLENPEEESLSRTPDLRISQMKFLLQHIEPQNLELKKKLIKEIEDHEMAPFYSICCKDLHWKEDSQKLKRMEEANAIKLKELDSKIEDAMENLGESEHREALLAKSDYLTQIGDKSAALEASKLTMEKTVGIGNRMDLIFSNIRLGKSFYKHGNNQRV